jgi:hypothetical protein
MSGPPLIPTEGGYIHQPTGARARAAHRIEPGHLRGPLPTDPAWFAELYSGRCNRGTLCTQNGLTLKISYTYQALVPGDWVLFWADGCIGAWKPGVDIVYGINWAVSPPVGQLLPTRMRPEGYAWPATPAAPPAAPAACTWPLSPATLGRSYDTPVASTSSQALLWAAGGFGDVD